MTTVNQLKKEIKGIEKKQKTKNNTEKLNKLINLKSKFNDVLNKQIHKLNELKFDP